MEKKPWWFYVLLVVGILGTVNRVDISTTEGLFTRIIGIVCLIIVIVTEIIDYIKKKKLKK